MRRKQAFGSQSLRIEPLAKKFEAHISGPKDAKLHLRSIFWDHESDGHTNQLMNPVVLEDYLSREFRVVSAISAGHNAFHRGISQILASKLKREKLVPMFS